MKLFVKLMLALLVLAFLLPFTLLKDDQGNTLMSFSDLSVPDFKLPGLPKFSLSESLISSQAGSGSVDTFYKWYDPKGNVQFTSEPPPDGVAYTVKQYDPSANVIQGVRLPVEQTAAEPVGTSVSSDSTQVSANPYNSEGIKKVFDDTRNIEKLLNQRTQSHNDIINQ